MARPIKKEIKGKEKKGEIESESEQKEGAEKRGRRKAWSSSDVDVNVDLSGGQFQISMTTFQYREMAPRSES